MKSLFTTRVRSYKVEWFEEEPCVRTVLVNNGGVRLRVTPDEVFIQGNIPSARPGVIRLPWPRVIFAVVRGRRRKFMSLHSFSSPVPVTSEDDVLRVLPHGNFLGRTGQVCLGSANERVMSGDLDPIEAFWNTSFSDVNMIGGLIQFDS